MGVRLIPFGRRPAAAGLLAIALLAGGASLGAAAMQPDEERRAHVGEVLLLKLEGNRDAGYRWSFNREASRGADLVTVDQVAWNKRHTGTSIFFAPPAVLTIAVVAKAPGEADLAFDYVRTWGKKPLVRTHVVRVIIGPKVD